MGKHKAMESCFGENMMKTSLLKMNKAMSMMHKGQQQTAAAPIQLVLGQQQAPQDNMLKKMFMKMMMKKMFSEHMDDDNESPFGSMGASKYSMDSGFYQIQVLRKNDEIHEQ